MTFVEFIAIYFIVLILLLLSTPVLYIVVRVVSSAFFKSLSIETKKFVCATFIEKK